MSLEPADKNVCATCAKHVMSVHRERIGVEFASPVSVKIAPSGSADSHFLSSRRHFRSNAPTVPVN
jgi:hypothetical protein